MANKNAYEIRAEVLAMAKDFLDKQQEMNVEFARQIFAKAVEAGKATVDEWANYAPKMYSIEDLMAKAQELYTGFITKKEQQIKEVLTPKSETSEVPVVTDVVTETQA